MRDRPRAWTETRIDLERLAAARCAIGDALGRVHDCTPGDAHALTQVRFALESAQAALRDLERPVAQSFRLVRAK